MKNVKEIETRIKEFESLKKDLLLVNDGTVMTMIIRLEIKIDELNWVLGLE